MKANNNHNLYISRHNCCSERGAAFVEFAISFPLYMMLVLGIIELLYYNYQCINAQHVVSLAAEHLAKGELTDRNGASTITVVNQTIPVELAPNKCIDERKNSNAAASQALDLLLAKEHVIYLATQFKSDFGTAQMTDVEGKSTVDILRANARTGTRLGGGRLGNVQASNFGNISICAIGEVDAAGQPVACGWNDDPVNHKEKTGRSALHGQRIPKTGYPVSITLRYPHRPVVLLPLAPLIGYFPIQAEAIIRMEPRSRPSDLNFDDSDCPTIKSVVGE